MKNHLRKLALVVGIVAVATVVVTVGASAHPANSHTIKAGGTLNVGWENNFADMSDSFDPTGEYLGDAWGILSGLMVRNLVSYKHVAGAAGNVLVPDIATSVPKATNGGKTYTFHLKPNIKFSPPVNRAVTSADFVTALDRLANPKDGGEYAFYFQVIKGWSQYAAGKASHISGISTPNKSTIIFNLTQPAGDFLLRLAMPAASPMPAEVMKCFEGKPGAYGRDIVSTAGYMFKGEDQVNISSCAAIKPASGFDGLSMMDLVRNPNAAPDSYRHNYADEVRFLTDANSTDIYNKIQAGSLDTAISSIPSQVGATLQHRPEPEEVPPHQRRRPHLVPDDEPDAASVRRRSRPQGDELGHGQGCSAAGVGRCLPRPDREPRHPGCRVLRTSSPTTSRTAPLVTTAAPRRRWRR